MERGQSGFVSGKGESDRGLGGKPKEVLKTGCWLGSWQPELTYSFVNAAWSPGSFLWKVGIEVVRAYGR